MTYMATRIVLKDITTFQRVVSTLDDVTVPAGHTWMIMGAYVLPGAGYAPPSLTPRDGNRFGEVVMSVGERIVHRMNAITLMDSWYARSVTRVHELRDLVGHCEEHAQEELVEKINDILRLCAPTFWQPVVVDEPTVLRFRRCTTAGTRIADPLQVELWIRQERSLA